MLYDLIKDLIRRNPDLAHAMLRISYNPDYQIPDETLAKLEEQGYVHKGSIRSNVLLFIHKNVGMDARGKVFLSAT